MVELRMVVVAREEIAPDVMGIDLRQEQRRASQSDFPSVYRGRQGMVRAGKAEGDDLPGVSPKNIPKQELQLADLVPAVGLAAQIVPLYEETIQTDTVTQLTQLLYWGREQAQRYIWKLPRQQGIVAEERKMLGMT